MKRLLLLPPLLLVLAIYSCLPSRLSWHQRLTVIVDTPQGERRGAAVTEVTYTKNTGPIRLPEGGGNRTEVTGEAVVVEIAPGRYLFALLSGSNDWDRDAANWVYPAYGLRATKSYDDAMRIVKSQPYDTPVPLPPEGWPLLVTFDDITKPETVRLVDPADLAASFGPGVSLKTVTLEITADPVTEGLLDAVLGWLGPYAEPRLIPADGRSTKAPFGMTISQGDFIQRGRP